MALEGTVVPCALVPSGKEVGMTSLPVPRLGSSSTPWSNLKVWMNHVFLHSPCRKRDGENVELEELSSSGFTG